MRLIDSSVDLRYRKAFLRVTDAAPAFLSLMPFDLRPPAFPEEHQGLRSAWKGVCTELPSRRELYGSLSLIVLPAC